MSFANNIHIHISPSEKLFATLWWIKRQGTRRSTNSKSPKISSSFLILRVLVIKLLINRPSVAGADRLVKISSKHSQSQTGRARKLTFWENVHPTLYVMCHVSCVTCQVSPVTSQPSRVKVYFFLTIYLSFIKIYKVVELVSGVYVINGAYPV